MLPALGHDGFLGDDQGVITLTKHGVNPRKHAWAQLQAPVVNAGTHANRAAIGVNQRIDRQHRGRELATWQGVQFDHGRLTASDFGLKAFGQTVVHKNGIDVFDVDNVSTIFEVVTDADRANAGQTVKGGNDFQTCCRGAGQSQFGLSDLLGGSAFVQRAAADEVLRHQIFVSLVVGQGDVELGLRLLHLGGGKLVVKLHQ